MGTVGLIAGCTAPDGTTVGSSASTSATNGSASGSPSSVAATPSATSSTLVPTEGSAPSATTATTPATGAAGSLPATTAWQPNSGEIQPAAKLAAVRHVEAAASTTHAIQVVDAQYGGLLDATASVLVVCREWQVTPAGVQEAGSTYDVRVTRSGSTWQVTATNPSQPGAASKSLTSAAQAVLASSRVVLPPAGRADIASGQVHDSVLAAMLKLADSFEIGVSVVRTGHPLLVFGTNRPSDHPQGRAFDTYKINGQLVVDPATPKSLITNFMQAAASAGSYNVGGPYLLGSAPQYFSDQTHHDHVHAGFSS
jgi:hypothetical protein